MIAKPTGVLGDSVLEHRHASRLARADPVGLQPLSSSMSVEGRPAHSRRHETGYTADACQRTIVEATHAIVGAVGCV